MKRTLPFILALSVAPLASVAHADPAQVAPAAPVAAPAPAPVVDAAATATLEKSAAAYKALTSYSTQFTSVQKTADKTLTTTGSFSFTSPDKARVEIVTGDPGMATPAGKNILVANGLKVWNQLPTTPATYRVIDLTKPIAPPMLISQVNPYAGFMYSSVLSGIDLSKLGTAWETVSAGPDNTVKLVGHDGPSAEPPHIVLTAKFDPTTNLISSATYERTFKGVTTVKTTTFSAAKANTDLGAEAFTYTPAADVKLYVEPPMYDPKLVAGVIPYNLKGLDQEGKAVDLSAYKGKVVLLDFWATWCGPCVAELPNVLKNYDTYHPQGFDVVGVSLDSDKKALTDFIAKKDMKYRNVFDGQGWKNVDATTYGVQAIPFSLLIGKDGKIAAVNPRGDKLEPAIKAALAAN